MKLLNIIACLLFLPLGLLAQKAWIEPSGSDFDPDKEATIYVDVSKTECTRLVASQEPLFLWTWMPSDPNGTIDDDGDSNTPPVNVGGNGSWTESNPLLEMTKRDDIGPDVWSFTFVPTQFYGVAASDVYNNDFSFLVKKKDGTGEGGGGCDEDKTEDLKVEVDPPGLPKVLTIPAGVSGDTVYCASTADDLFTIRYDFNVEDNPNLLDATNFYVYLRGFGTDDQPYKVAPTLSKVDETPELRMKEVEPGIYVLSFIPNEFFVDVPDGVDVKFIFFQIAKEGFRTTSDIVSIGNKNVFQYLLNCE